jgi:hypothetical protein
LPVPASAIIAVIMRSAKTGNENVRTTRRWDFVSFFMETNKPWIAARTKFLAQGGRCPRTPEKVAAEIRAVADSRGDDSAVVELAPPPTTGRMRRPSLVPPMPNERIADDDELTAEDLRDAWPLLDL